MAENVTELFQGYRRCLRDIWNTHFWQHEHLRNWASLEVFKRLKPSIFQALVVENLCDSCGCEPATMAGAFHIVPNVPDNKGNRLATHVVVRRPLGSGQYGAEELLPTIGSADAVLHFVDLFDWSMMGYADLRYYVAKIVSFPARPDLEGYEVLIDVTEADVFYRETEETH